MASEVKIRPFKELLTGSWEVFKKVWKNYLWLFLIESALMALFTIVVTGGSVIATFFETGSLSIDPTVMSTAWPMFAVGLIVLIPVSIALQLAIYRTVYSGLENTEMNIKENIKYGFKNIWPFFLVSLLLGLILLGGYLLLIVPGIILTLMYSMYYPVYIVEDVRGYSVLKRSNELTKGYKWAILGKYVLVFLVYLLASVVVGIIGGLLGDFVNGLLEQVLAFFAAPILIAYTYLIYTDLKAVK